MIKRLTTALAVVGVVAVPTVAIHAMHWPAQKISVAPAVLAAEPASYQAGTSDTETDHQPYTIGVRLSQPSCPVYWNLDATGDHAAGKPGWDEKAMVSVRSGGTVHAAVGWRYNVNSRWALIASRREKTPYWGFIERSCLADPPQRILSGHAHSGGWDTVHFRPVAGTIAGTRHLTTAATVRSGPNGYVIGNLRSGATFHWSHRCGHRGPWVFGWAPDANTWGWILAGDIGNPCTPNDYPTSTGSHSSEASTAATPTQGSPAPHRTAATQAATPPASAPAPAAPAGGPSAQCYPQYTVTEHARARSTRAGTPIGDVEPGAHVNVRSNDGSWLYGYISQIGAGAGGFGWLLDEKVVRTGTFCG
ncbi:hypothetical protein [Frankia sp. Cj3]|uniref:hypothetical protein n=2 Tax=unclassified Frankia TaxID=2632575 RepID=UPI001EF57879|nr:hypothetical protein [Frankia sp. Cj3]